jgi:transcriptional antiterminator NusG
MIFVVKVSANKEEQGIDLIAERVKKKQLAVYSIARPHGLRGYIILEARDHETAQEATFNLPYVKQIIKKEINYSEIKNLLEPVAIAVNIEKNDIVEMIAEPFKKEKAKVVRIDRKKEEAVVELLGTAIPIPIVVKLDNIKVIRRDEKESEEKLE